MVQHTFDKVPEIGQGYQLLQERRDAPISRPAMTSRMAKKAYQKKSATRKLSRQEERIEQLRIKAELRERDEREKRERKAEALRDKKREKEQRMKDDRKKKGLPLVDVRPSQETLTKFFRGNGSTKKRDSAGASVQLDAVEEETSAADSDNPEAGKAPEKQLPSPVPVAVDEKAKPALEEAATPAPPKPFKRFRTGCTPRKEDAQTTAPPRATNKCSKPESADNKDVTPKDQPHQSSQEPEHEEHEEDEEHEDSEYAKWGRNYVPTATDMEVEQDILEGIVDDMQEQAAVRMENRRRWIPAWGNHCRQKDYDPHSESCFDDLSDPEDNWTEGFMELQDMMLLSRKPSKTIAAPKIIEQPVDSSISASRPLETAAKKEMSFAKENRPPQPAAPIRDLVQPRQVASNLIQPQPLAQVKPLAETSANGANSKQMLPPKRSMPPPPIPPRVKSSLPGMTAAAKPTSKSFMTPVSRPLLRQATHGSAWQIVDTPGSDMPSCTQLLDISMSDLVDLLPSPSQEFRELGGPSITSKPAVSKPPAPKPQVPAWQPKPSVWNPPPRVWQPAQLAAPSSPFRAPAIRAQAAPPAEDFPSFFSTQDLVFSSQDIREVETPKSMQPIPPAVQAHKPLGTTPLMRPSPVAPKPASSHPSAGISGFITDLIDDVEDPCRAKPRRQEAPVNAVSRAANCQPTQGHSALIHAARYGRPSSQTGTPQPPSSVQSSAGFVHETPCRAGGAASTFTKPVSSRVEAKQDVSVTSAVLRTVTPSFATKVPRPSRRRSVSPARQDRQDTPASTTTADSHPAQIVEPQPNTPQPSASPPRRRLLTSSNIPLLVAEERSRKSFREDQRKRELREQEAELLRRKEEAEQMRKEAEDLRALQEEADKTMMGGSSVDDIMNDDFFLQQMFSQRMVTAISQAKADNKTSVAAASQETDYGDLDFPTMTQLGMAPTQGKKADPSTARRIEASQETDYGDVDLDMVGEYAEDFLKETDFLDDDYP